MTIETSHKDASISQLAMFVIDVLRYDIESISSIVNLLNGGGSVGWRFAWPHDFTEAEVVQALMELSQKNFVRVLRESESLKEIVPVEEDENIWNDTASLWFELTQQGRQVWDEWDNPPIEEESSNE